MPYAQTREQAILKHKSGRVPSMTFLMSQWIPELAAAGVLEPLNKYFTKEELSVYPEGFLEDVSYKGKIYAVPTYSGPICLYVNKKLLKMAGYDPPRNPKSIEDFKEMIQKVSELGKDEKGNTIYGFALRTSQDKNSAWWFVPWVWNYGGQLADENDNPTLDTPEFRKALEFYQWMGTNKYAPLGQTVHDTRNLFAQGTYGFVHDGPWLRGILRNITGQDKEKPKDPDKYIDNMYVTIMMPVGASGVATGHANQTCQGVFSKAENKDEIVKYLKWRSTDPWVCEQRFDMTGMMPASKKVLAQPKYQNDKFLKAFADNIPYMKGTPWKSIYWTGMQDIIAVAMQEALIGKDIDKIAKKAQDEVEDLVD
jgi:multiple sugar transport system substrate-binding protein